VDPEYILRIERDPEEGHLQGFRNRPEFISFIALVRPYVKDIEEMRHYRVIGKDASSPRRVQFELANLNFGEHGWDKLRFG
jgi:hypothetical protein